MIAADLLINLTRRGYRLIPRAQNILHIEPTPPPDTLELVRRHKRELLTELRRQTPPVAHDRRRVAMAALARLEPNPAIRSQVLAAAEREERGWSFLVRDHGYPAGWFILSHVDNFLRLTHRKGIATEGPGDVVSNWWIFDAPAEVATLATATKPTKLAETVNIVAAEPPKQGNLLP